MSRIGRKPVAVPEGITVSVEDDAVEVKGPNATLSVPVLFGVNVKVADGEVNFETHKNSKQAKSNWGTMRALVANAIAGAKEDYSKTLVIEGVGYRAAMEGKTLVLNLGYSHQIKFEAPEGVTVEVEGANTIKISGASKADVGEAAATIRSYRKPEPYKGKGIRYHNEVVKRKSGKKAIGTAG